MVINKFLPTNLNGIFHNINTHVSASSVLSLPPKRPPPLETPKTYDVSTWGATLPLNPKMADAWIAERDNNAS